MDIESRGQELKNWSRLYIMHKDRHVATIRKNGKCTVYYPSFMPYNLYLEQEEDLDTRLSNLNNFFYWCSGRLLTLDRKYAKEILNSIGAMQAVTDKDRAMIAISYHCLSLTDVFWVKSYHEELTFDEISLYRHSLSNAFADVSLRGISITAQNAELIGEQNVAGDIGTQGVAPKAWIRREDGFYLYKDGERRDVEAELLASRILGCFNVKHVTYTPDTFSGIQVAKCPIITSEDVSIVSFEYVSVYCENHDRDTINFVLKRDRRSFYMMNIMDYLLGNVDRHWGNWGFFVNNANNKLEGMYPLMDFNKAFFAYDTIEGAKCLPLGGKLTQREAAVDAVHKVGLNQTEEILPEWFTDNGVREMFFTRLNLLRTEAGLEPIADTAVDADAVTSGYGTMSVSDGQSNTGVTLDYEADF